MEKMGYEKNLISFTSEHELKGGTTKIFRGKLIGYAVVLMVMSGLLIADIATRVPLEVDIIRDRNSLDRETNSGLIENVYTLKILNKSQQERTYTINVIGLVDAEYFGDKNVTVDGGGVFTLPISVATDPSNLEVGTQKIYFHVSTSDEQGDTIEVEEPTTFIFTGV
jgi:polyferredoxin